MYDIQANVEWDWGSLQLNYSHDRILLLIILLGIGFCMVTCAIRLYGEVTGLKIHQLACSYEHAFMRVFYFSSRDSEGDECMGKKACVIKKNEIKKLLSPALFLVDYILDLKRRIPSRTSSSIIAIHMLTDVKLTN